MLVPPPGPRADVSAATGDPPSPVRIVCTSLAWERIQVQNPVCFLPSVYRSPTVVKSDHCEREAGCIATFLLPMVVLEDTGGLLGELACGRAKLWASVVDQGG